MLKAHYIGSGEKGVSRRYKVIGPTTELNKFIEWNLNQVDKNGMPIPRKDADVLIVPTHLYNEMGEIIGKKSMVTKGLVRERPLLMGERAGQMTWELVPDAAEQTITAIIKDEGVELATTLVNLGVINMVEIREAQYGNIKSLPTAGATPTLEPITLSNAIDLSVPTENSQPEESKPTTESKNSEKKG